MQASLILQEFRPPNFPSEVNLQSTAEPPSGYLPQTTEPESEAEYRRR